jgi:ATP-binding cassette subfamily B protein/ATP-binding cassette subfamily C protein
METDRKLLPFKKSISVFVWSIKQVITVGGFENYIYIFLNIVQSIIPSILALIAGKLLDSLTQLYGTNISIESIYKPGIDAIDLLLLTGVLTIFSKLIDIYSNYLQRKFIDYYGYIFEDKLALNIAQLDLSYFDNHETASLVLKARQNSHQVKNVFDKFILLSGFFVNLLTSAYFIFSTNIFLGLFVFLTSIPKSLIHNKYVKLWWSYRNKNYDLIKLRNGVNHTLTTPVNITQARVMNHLKTFEKYLNNLSNEIGLNGFLNVRKWRAKFDSFTSIFDAIRTVGIPLFLLPNLLKGTTTVGTTYFLLGRANDFASTIANFFGELTELFDQLVGASEVKAVFEFPKIIEEGKKKISKNNNLDIEFKSVWFKYPDTDRYIFKDLSLFIPFQSEIAIVGVNGVGKSTFIKLLLRMYDVQKGEILIGGVNIKEYSLTSFYSIMSILFQDYSLYSHLTIEQNLTWGELKVDKAKINSVLKLAEAESIIEQSTLGLDQRLDRGYKDGMLYSSGQKQKLAIARLLYKESKILILDEPTASIDPVSEYKIFKRIYEHMNKKTVIIISHRFSTVRNAQTIYVFDKGTIAEQGSHSELLKIDGIYADAFNKQAEGYVKED